MTSFWRAFVIRLDTPDEHERDDSRRFMRDIINDSDGRWRIVHGHRLYVADASFYVADKNLSRVVNFLIIILTPHTSLDMKVSIDMLTES